MFYFLYGEDSYRIKDKVAKIKAEFIKRDGGDFNIIELSGGNLTANQLISEVSILPFLGKERLLVIKGLLSEGKENVQNTLLEKISNLPSHLTLVLNEAGNIDRRKSIFKKFFKTDGAEEFIPLEGAALSKWITQKCQELGVAITQEANQKLQIYVGSDLWRLENEIDKLRNYVLFREGKEVTASDVSVLVVAPNDPNIFTFIDAIGQKRQKVALELLHSFFKKGENENYIFSMIVYQFRNMLMVSDLLRSGQTNLSQTGLHPFVITKLKQSLKNYSFASLKKIYELLAEADYRSKTGKAGLSVLLDLLVVNFSKK